MAGNANLCAAKAAKNDEFYTQWNDIENEMNAYLDYNQDAFRGKTVLLPCDDPEWSNFTKYFALNFESLGIEKLISTSYAPAKSQENGRIFVLERDVTCDGKINIHNIEWDYLNGDGDFRSEEVTALRDEADMVITNPPFSLFREFVSWLVEGGVEFSVIGNMNAIAYKEIFPLIKGNEMWLGASRMGAKYFALPSNAPVKANQHEENGVRFQKFGNIAWFTNIEHGRRHGFLELMTMEDNIRYCRRKVVRERGYSKYDNYDAIEVSFTEAIPSDCDGVMGVPISFLDKYSPEQFEILGISEASGKGGSGDLWDRTSGVKHPLIAGDRTYTRIFIRHRNPERKESRPLSRSWGGQSSLRCKRGFSHVEVRG